MRAGNTDFDIICSPALKLKHAFLLVTFSHFTLCINLNQSAFILTHTK